MFSIAVCDDEPVIGTLFEKALDSYIQNKKIQIDIYYSGEGLYEQLQQGACYDLIFLDIELGAVNGVSVGRMIREELCDEKLQIVYISGKTQYAMELFEIRPMNFLVKPISSEEIVQNVEKAMQLLGLYEEVFEFKYGTEIFRIPYGKILYFESQNRKVTVKMKEGERMLYAKLDAIQDLCPAHFTRIHQSYLINNMQIASYRSDTVVMMDGEELPISKKYKKAVNALLFNHGGRLN